MAPLIRPYNVPFSSLPPALLFGGGAESPVAAEPVRDLSYSCPSPGMYVPQLSPKSKWFTPHWTEDAVNEAVKDGKVFLGKFRVNAHSPVEAYCTVDGLPVDVLINGAVAQNRAIEGDIVAIMLDPIVRWTKIKGQVISYNHVAQDACTTSDVSGLVVSSVDISRHADASCRYENGNAEMNMVNHGPNNDTCCEPVIPGNGQPATYQGESARALERIQAMVYANPNKRPTGKVVSILKKTYRREAIVGHLSTKPLALEGEWQGKQINGCAAKKNMIQNKELLHLLPTDRRFPRMVVNTQSLPHHLHERLTNGDGTVEKELVAARIDDWDDESLCPVAHILHSLGRGGEIETHIGAILFENGICSAKFSPDALKCLPELSWKIPQEEIKSRMDMRNILTLTIDPKSAKDLDDALSVEVVSDSLFRIGVHIADVSYFVHPGTELDAEAQIRSVSVYLSQLKIPMLPPELSETVVSLAPGADRLALSIVWDIDSHGNISSRWIGRSIISSCCKLSYDLVQDIINENFDQSDPQKECPQLHGKFGWSSVIESLKYLYVISKKLKEARFKDGALELESYKLLFSIDEEGNPYESFREEKKEACSIVEEFMLLANMSAAEVISQAFPDCALLRRHPEPNLRKLKEFEAFCDRNGFVLNASSSGQFHLSLAKMREKLKDDQMLSEIFISYASKPMQAAAYFCTGDLREKRNEWGHYALSVPLYTHFTSPIRRYPDVIVHRTLCAVIEAEERYLKHSRDLVALNQVESTCGDMGARVFTGLQFNKVAASSKEGREAFCFAALKFQIPGSDSLGAVAAYCNERKLASRRAEETVDKLYLWALLKQKKILFSAATVVGLGPKFISVYVQKLACEKRIYYDEVDRLVVEWLNSTGVLLLDVHRSKSSQRKGTHFKYQQMEDVVLLQIPSEQALGEAKESNDASDVVSSTIAAEDLLAPSVLPLVLRQLSVIPVALHAIGGEDGPLDFGVRFYVSSYFK